MDVSNSNSSKDHKNSMDWHILIYEHKCLKSLKVFLLGYCLDTKTKLPGDLIADF